MKIIAVFIAILLVSPVCFAKDYYDMWGNYIGSDTTYDETLYETYEDSYEDDYRSRTSSPYSYEEPEPTYDVEKSSPFTNPYSPY